MESVLDKQIVLNLNANWQPIGWRTVRQAIISLTGGDHEHPAMAIDISLGLDGNLMYANPVEWEEWIKFEVRPGDLAISTPFKAIRAPLAIVSRNYRKMPSKAPRLTRKAILERDGFTCAYTGKKLPQSQLNVDHVIPRDRGGKDEWGNLVACDREINSKKGNRLNSECGLSLKNTPKAPKPIPASYSIIAKRPEHIPFIQ